MNEVQTNSLSIKENSWIARLAAKKLRAGNVAIVLGRTIYLYNVSRQELLKNEKLLKHELCHIRQFQQHGFITFVAKYLWESINKGYLNNKFEVEARRAENL